MRVISLACVLALSVFVPSGAYALDAAAPATAEMKPNKPPSAAAPGDAAARSAKSIECSQKADAQGLHGKPRKRFMRECKRGE